MKTTILALALAIFSTATCNVNNGTIPDYLDFNDCGSLYFVDRLEIQGCSSDADCIFFIGQNRSVSFEIRTVLTTKQLANEVFLLAKGMQWDLTASPDPCLAMPCPIQNEYSATYHATVYVNEVLLPLAGELNWIMRGDQGLQYVCFSLPVIFDFEDEDYK